MDSRVILSKIVTLIYRSRIVGNTENDDLARTILNTIKTDAPEFNFNGHNAIKRLKEFAIELLEEKDPIAKEVIMQSAIYCGIPAANATFHLAESVWDELGVESRE